MTELSKNKPTPEGWTKEDQRAWNNLRRRFPGIEAETEKAALRFAVTTGQGPKVRIALHEEGGKYFAYVEGYTLLHEGGTQPLTFPVIPDEHNPNQDKKITTEMAPHLFDRSSDCMAAAGEHARELAKRLQEMEKEARDSIENPTS